MALPEHKQDLIDLKQQIEEKLARLDLPVLNLDGETVWNYRTVMPKLPADINQYEACYTTNRNEDYTGWFNATAATGWYGSSWGIINKIKFRKILPKEQKVKVNVEFTTYVPGVTVFNHSVNYLLMIAGNAAPVAIPGHDIKFPEHITSYRVLGFL